MGLVEMWHLWLCLSVCACVCPCSKRKMARAVNTKLVRHTVHGSLLAFIDPEVQRSRLCSYQMRCHCQCGYAGRYDCLVSSHERFDADSLPDVNWTDQWASSILCAKLTTWEKNHRSLCVGSVVTTRVFRGLFIARPLPIQLHFVWTECTVKWPSLLWLQPVRMKCTTYYFLIGCSDSAHR